MEVLTVMADDDPMKHVAALRGYAAKAKDEPPESKELTVKKAQLAGVQRLILQFGRRGVPVPRALNDERLRLAAEVKEFEQGKGSCRAVYEALLDVVEALGRVCHRRPRHDLAVRDKARGQQAAPPEDLRQAIIEALQELGGSGRDRDVMARIENLLKSKLTDADREQPQGKRARWQTNARKERRRMLKDGLLTEDSRGSRWTLAS
jgi:hypothetical protein